MCVCVRVCVCVRACVRACVWVLNCSTGCRMCVCRYSGMVVLCGVYIQLLWEDSNVCVACLDDSFRE